MFDEPSVFGTDNAFSEDAPALPGTEASMSGSPDGLGEYGPPPTPGETGLTPYPDAPFPQGDMAGTWAAIEPTDTSPASAMRSAGFTALFVTLAVGAGIALGGPWGAGSGLLLSGAAANVYRAQKWWGSSDPSEKQEAIVSAVFATFGIGLGGYMAYKAYEAHPDEKEA